MYCIRELLVANNGVSCRTKYATEDTLVNSIIFKVSCYFQRQVCWIEKKITSA